MKEAICRGSLHSSGYWQASRCTYHSVCFRLEAGMGGGFFVWEQGSPFPKAGKGQKRTEKDDTWQNREGRKACSYRQKKANLNPEHDNGCSWEKQTFQLCPISHDCGNILAKHKQKGNVNAFCCSWLADEEESDWLKCVWWSKFFQPAPNDERLFVFGLCCFNMMEQMCWLPAPTLMQQTQN